MKKASKNSNVAVAEVKATAVKSTVTAVKSTVTSKMKNGTTVTTYVTSIPAETLAAQNMAAAEADPELAARLAKIREARAKREGGKAVAAKPVAAAPKAAKPVAAAPKAAKPVAAAPKAAEPIVEPALQILGALEAAGFQFIANQGTNAGYQHKDGRAVIVQKNNAWTLAQPNGAKTAGTSVDDLSAALTKPVQKMPDTSKLKGKEKMYNCVNCGKLTRPMGDGATVGSCEDCWEQGGDENAVLDGTMTQAEYDKKWAARTGEAPSKVEGMLKAAGKGQPKSAPSVPANVVRAVEVLGGITLQRFNIEALSGDKHYKHRITLLKTLLKTDKILVKDSGVNRLCETFYSAVGVGSGKTHAAKLTEFITRCKAIGLAARTEKAKAKRDEKDLIQKALRATVAQRTVPGTILPGGKPMTKEQRAAELVKAKKDLQQTLILQATEGPVARPRPDAQLIVVPGDVQLLEDPKNGIVMMQLERSNSQGAICVYNNGSRVSAGVIPTEILRNLRPVPGVDLLQAANQLLNPIVPTIPVTPVAASHLTAVIHCKEMKAMTSATENKNPKFAAPATAAKKSAKPAKKATAKAEKPAKKAAAKGAVGATRHDPASKIKGIKPNPLREGTFCWAQVEAVNASKTLGEAQEKLAKDKKHNANGRALEVGWLSKKGYLTVL